jgi:hypothetical protein
MNIKQNIMVAMLGGLFALVAFQALTPGTAVAQWVAPSGIGPAGGTVSGPISVGTSYFRSTAASGQPAFVMDTTGARICFNGVTCTAFWASGPGSTVTGNMIPSFGRYEASATSLAYQAGSVTAGNNAFSVGINGARYDIGTGTDDFLSSDGTNIQTGTQNYRIVKTLAPVTSSLNFGSISIANCADLTISVTNAADGDVVSLGVPNAAVVAGSTFMAWVSAANTVSVRHCCDGSATCDPGVGNFTAAVSK